MREESDASFTVSLLLVLSFVGVTTLLLFVFFRDLVYNGEAYYLFCLFLIPIINTFSVASDAKIQREFNYKIIAKITVVCSLFTGILSLCLALWGAEEWSIVIGRIVYSCLLSSSLIYYSKYVSRFGFNRAEIVKLYDFIKPLFLSRILTFCSERSSQIMVGTFLGANMFAFLSIANRPYMEIQQATLGQINKVLINTLSRSKNNHEDICLRLAMLVAAILVPVFLGLSVISELFLTGILGEQWQGSVILMSLFGVQIFVIIFCWFTDSFFIATSNTKYIFKIVRIEFVIKIVCSLIAVQFGLVYLVGINIIISFSMIYVRYKYFTSIVKVSFSQVFKQVLPSICVGILMYAAVSVYLNYFTDVINNEYLLLVTAILVGGCTYLGLYFLIFNRMFKTIHQEAMLLIKG